MNRTILIFFVVSLMNTTLLNAQLIRLRVSPAQKIQQRVGVTDVTVEFSRPQIRGRKIFGGLVPYAKMWRTGANENTKLSLSHKVKISGKDVSAGTYGLFTKPMKDYWEIYLYKDSNNWGLPRPIDDAKLIYLTKAKVHRLKEPQEALTINFYDLTRTTANLGISWENTMVKIPIEFFTDQLMEDFIEKEFTQNASDYSIAASYYYEKGVELEKARKLQELVIELRETPNAWDYRSYAMILYKLGEATQAFKAIDQSLSIAKRVNNNYLISINEQLLKEWKK